MGDYLGVRRGWELEDSLAVHRYYLVQLLATGY